MSTILSPGSDATPPVQTFEVVTVNEHGEIVARAAEDFFGLRVALTCL